MNKKEIIDAIMLKTHYTRREIEHIVELFLEEASQALEKKDKVVLSNFGTLEVRSRKERVVKNPNTGEDLRLEAQDTVAFKIGKGLKERIR